MFVLKEFSLPSYSTYIPIVIPVVVSLKLWICRARGQLFKLPTAAWTTLRVAHIPTALWLQDFLSKGGKKRTEEGATTILTAMCEIRMYDEIWKYAETIRRDCLANVGKACDEISARIPHGYTFPAPNRVMIDSVG